MKKSVQIFFQVVILSAFAISCKNSTPKAETQLLTFDLKVLPEKTILKLSDLGAVDIQYLPLETTEKSVIPRIRNVIFSKNYFLTQYFSNVNMFRYDGSFVNKIGINGRGPNEFTVAHDIDINSKNESIYLVDGWQQKFLVYSRNGDFIKTFKSPLAAAVNFKFTDDGILFYNSNNMGNMENSFNLVDTTGKIIKNFPNKYPWTRTVPNVAYMGENLFYRFNGRLIKKEMYSDTLYAYNNKDKDFDPYLIMDVGKLRLTPDLRTKSTAQFIMENFQTPVNLFEFGDFIYYELIIPRNGKGEGLAFIGSKSSNYKVLFDPEKDLINDLDGGPAFWPRTIKDDNTLIAWVDALQLKSWVASEAFKNSAPKLPEKKKELETLANSLKETDNPVLIMVKLKK